MKTITLQDLSEGLTEATIREWYVEPGQQLKKGELLVAFETAKAIMEAPMPHDGTIKALLLTKGDRIEAEQALVELAD